MYKPVSPRSSYVAKPTYEPRSPKHTSVYIPQSPRGPKVVGGLLGKLLEDMKKKPEPYVTRYVPICNFDNYIANKKRVEGPESERVKLVEAKHNSFMESYTPKEKTIKKRYSNPTPLDQPFVQLKVVGDKINVTIEAPPMMIVQDVYYSKGVKPPIEVHLRQLKKFGHSNEVLQSVLDYHNKEKQNLKKNTEFLELVFGKGKKKN